MSTKKLTMAAIFASLTCVATMYLHIDTPRGYMNLGDTLILIGALFLDPVSSLLSAGIGSALADLILGYAMYAPATFVIKAAMGFLASFMAIKFKKKIPVVLLAYFLSELIMIVLYTIYDMVLYGKGVILATLPGNITQGVLNLVIAFVLFLIIRKNKLFRSIKF